MKELKKKYVKLLAQDTQQNVDKNFYSHFMCNEKKKKRKERENNPRNNQLMSE